MVSLAMYILHSVLVGVLQLDAYMGDFLCVSQKKYFFGDVKEV